MILNLYSLVGGMAQWLGHRSLDGRLSVIYAWSMVDMRALLGKVSAMGLPTRPTQSSIPSGWWMSSSPCNYMD